MHIFIKQAVKNDRIYFTPLWNLSLEVWQCNVINGVVSFVVSVGVVDLHRVQSWTDETVWLPVLSAGYVSITLSLGLHCCCGSMLCWPWCFQWTVGLFYRYVLFLIFNTNIFVKALKVQTREDINNNNNCFMALCLGLLGWAGTRRSIHPPIIRIFIQSLSASSIYYNP